MTAVLAATWVLVATAAPAGATTFANVATITIPDPNCTDPDAAVPYPSNITVSGLTGTVTDVNVTLNAVTHPFEGDLELLLVSPGGQNLVLLSDAGTGSLSNATLTFDDAGASQPPQNTAWPAGTYKPVNYTELSGADTFPAPAPAPSANTTLAGAFNGNTPNGTWSLYVIDDACPDAGSIAGGWSIDITTAAATATTTTLTSTLNPSRTGQSVTFTATVSSAGTVNAGTVTFTDGATVLAANVPVSASGVATFSTSSLTEGTHTVVATYNGNGTFATSNGSVNQRVDNDTTATGTTFCNTGAVTVNDNTTATPYPSNIFVTGAPASLGKVTATLKNVTHGFDGDLEALLVGPTGVNLVVVSDAGTAAVTNVTVNLDDAAASLLPASGAWAAPNATISAKPTNYSEVTPDVFPAPAPAPSSATTLAVFNGTNPNGTWSLYVKDDGAPDSGSIAGGWCLTLAAAQATPTVTTTASPSVVVGGQISDTAVLAGGTSPTGTITFNLYGPNDATCSGVAAFTSPKPVSGNGTYTSDAFTTTAPGVYRWVASYSSDPNNSAFTTVCNDPAETVTVTQPAATLTTSAQTPVTIGSPISDTATVTGAPSAPTPTGTVTFTLFGPNNSTCTGAPIFTSAAQPLAGGPPPTAGSGNLTPTAVGTYRWVATYGGDQNYVTVTSACNDAGESSIVSQATPTIATLATTPVAVGSPISDTATVTGVSSAPSPTGTVTFTLFGPGNPTCTGAAIFDSGAKALGAGSGNFTPATPGTYNWVAVYSGDTNYATATSPCGAPNETSTVGKANPTISTQASADGPIGTAVTDTATLAGGSSPTGTVTFRLFTDANCTSQVFTTTNALTGTTATSTSFTPSTVGVYRWTAVYNGDAANNPATSPCNAPNEAVTITKASPTIATQASAGGIVGVAVTDTATVAGGFSPTGTVTFRLFTENTCTNQVFTTSNALAGGSATSTGFTPGAAGTYYWTAVYNGDSNNNTATSPCNAPNESVVITPFQAPPYTQTVTGDLVGPLTVNAGQSVLITGGRVFGPITVNPGGALTIENSQIARGITATAPGFFSLCGTKVAGPTPAPTTALTVTGAPVPIRVGDPASGCAGNQFAGKVVLTGNAAVTFGANIVSESATIDTNGPGATVVKANRLYGTLGCSGNNPAPTNAGMVNTAAAKTGQCAGL